MCRFPSEEEGVEAHEEEEYAVISDVSTVPSMVPSSDSGDDSGDGIL